ncbi:MAG: zinc-ribbon domain-containing protein [Lutimaribacter sp.]
MRLVCPNCGAQYEVPEDVIPAAGRDVQCSNCGHTWFVAHPDSADATAMATEVAPEWETPASQPAAADDSAAYDGDLGEWEAPEDSSLHPNAPSAPNARRPLDPNIAELLRQEAEREQRQREAARSPLESQPDLGLQPPEETPEIRRHREATERMARLRGEDPQKPAQSGAGPVESAAAAAAVAGAAPPRPTHPRARGASAPAAAPAATPAQAPQTSPDEMAASLASRKALLPDVEQINSTLRANSERRPASADDFETPQSAGDDTNPNSGGFRQGLTFAVFVALILAALYIYAPLLGDRFAPLQPPLAQYTDLVDQARLWLDTQVQAVQALIAANGGSG